MTRTTALAVVLLVGLLPSFAVANPPLANQLRAHPSPYLSLHGADPVAWQEWNPAVLARAKQEGKLVLLSVGYFSCYWCHVMQRESFRDTAIAQFLNRHFIPVKIDRELEPALDARLMDFTQSTRGRAGWPLNVFLTPAGAPLYATLYLPPAEFLAALERIEALWRKDGKRLAALAERALPAPRGPGPATIETERVRAHEERLRETLLMRADALNGGFGEQGKFPSVPQLEFLLDAPHAKTREFILTTLDQMAANGLQDHLGGGFFRYTADPAWKTPHFEKMLYDNAQIARLYLRATRVLDRADYRDTALRTLDFMLRDMRHGDGGFVAALSAVDGHGNEGGYYLWDAATLSAVLTGQELAAYRLAAAMTDAPAFEHGHLPLSGLKPEEIAGRLRLAPGEVTTLLDRARNKLIAARLQRVLPRDIKRIAGWNGLALSAFVEAARDTGNERYREAAMELAHTLVRKFWDGQALHRALAGSKVTGQAAAEDYAYVTEGLLAWAKLTGAKKDYRIARQIAQAGWKKFYVTVDGVPGWQLSESGVLAAEGRQDMLPDGPMPSPSAVLIGASLQLAERDSDPAFRTKVLRALNADDTDLRDEPFWHATQVLIMRQAVGGERLSRP